MTAPASGYLYLVDDNSDVRRHTGALLRYLGYSTEVFASAAALLASLPSLRWPAVVLLDMRMPGLNGLALQARLRDMRLACGVVFISGESAPPEIVDAMKNGASDFLFKPVPVEELQQAIAAAMERAVLLAQTYRAAAEIGRGLADLSPREFDVLSRMLVGEQNREIASGLDIKPDTVKKHRSTICEKFGVPTTSDIIRLFGQAGSLVTTSALAEARGRLSSTIAPVPSPTDQLRTTN